MENKMIVHQNFFQETLPLNICRLNTNQDLVEKYSGSEAGKNFEILLLQQGSGIHFTNGMHIPFSNNTVFCGSSVQRLQLKADVPFTGYLISFSESFLRSDNDEEIDFFDSAFTTLLSQSSGLQLEKDMADEMNEIASNMMKELNRGLSLKMELLRQYLKILLLYLARQLDLQSSILPTNNSLLKKFIAAVNKDFRIKKLVKEYADLLSVSANHLNQSVKKESGNSARYHIKQRIITEAKRKAVYSDRSMKEIAYDLGFDTPSHFSKFFKNYVGTNFSSFKRFEQPISTSPLRLD